MMCILFDLVGPGVVYVGWRRGGGDVGWHADSGLWVGSVEGPDPRSWYVMNPVYFECSLSRTWSVYLFLIPQTDGFVSCGVLLCQLKRLANLHFLY
jgi:hypothetical protein